MMSTFNSMEDIERPLREMLSRYIDTRRLRPETAINHLSGLAGDDADEFLDEVEKRFGTSFSDISFDDFFDDEGEAFGEHILRLFGVRSRKKSLTFEHLTKVIEKGHWFEPQP